MSGTDEEFCVSAYANKSPNISTWSDVWVRSGKVGSQYKNAVRSGLDSNFYT